jgi:uncharacterized membrane protein YhaH (DUF805 family)
MDPNSPEMPVADMLAMLPYVVFALWVSFRVFRKAGRNGWLSLLLLVPVVNIVVVWVFAFMRWPALDARRP